jgi:hypothetical protein
VWNIKKSGVVQSGWNGRNVECYVQDNNQIEIREE